MKTFIRLLEENQTFLVKRILSYAKNHHFTRYTSSLEEAWIVSVSGLTGAMILSVSRFRQIPGIDLDRNPERSSIAAFGVLEAKRHRNRGITLEMYLGLMKYYRQAYLDLIMKMVYAPEQRSLYLLWINRFFDHTELAFCTEWCSQSKEKLVKDLQDTNREMTNVKNKYLTIFESIPTPVVILDSEDRLINLNFAAQQLLQNILYAPGHAYYSKLQKPEKIADVLPWLSKEIRSFIKEEKLELQIEKTFESPAGGKRNFVIRFQRILDFSQKITGTVIILLDLTERTKMEEQLRYMSYHDSMTGLYNRVYFEQELVRAAAGRYNPFGVISCDIDGLKLVNDSLGHSAGDAMIRTVGNILAECFRKSDVVARVGGDEFIALMPNSDGETVKGASARIRDDVKKHNELHPREPVGLSIGWAVGNVLDDKDAGMLIKEADARMYIEKRENKTRYASLFARKFSEHGEELFKKTNPAAERSGRQAEKNANL